SLLPHSLPSPNPVHRWPPANSVHNVIGLRHPSDRYLRAVGSTPTAYPGYRFCQHKQWGRSSGADPGVHWHFRSLYTGRPSVGRLDKHIYFYSSFLFNLKIVFLLVRIQHFAEHLEFVDRIKRFIRIVTLHQLEPHVAETLGRPRIWVDVAFVNGIFLIVVEPVDFVIRQTTQ